MINHHIITLYYQPTDSAKTFYESLSDQDIHFINAGSLKDSTDDWVKEHVEFETSFKDNIANLNPHFCELTTLYYAWKNLSPSWDDDDVVQHSHYRKTLDESDCPCDDGIPTVRVSPPYPMKFQTKRGFLQNCTVETGMLVCHPRPSWEAMENVLKSMGDWQDNSDFEIWRNLPYMPAPINVWSMPVRQFREYGEWLFQRAFEIDKLIPYEDDEYRTAY